MAFAERTGIDADLVGFLHLRWWPRGASRHRRRADRVRYFESFERQADISAKRKKLSPDARFGGGVADAILDWHIFSSKRAPSGMAEALKSALAGAGVSNKVKSSRTVLSNSVNS